MGGQFSEPLRQPSLSLSGIQVRRRSRSSSDDSRRPCSVSGYRTSSLGFSRPGVDLLRAPGRQAGVGQSMHHENGTRSYLPGVLCAGRSEVTATRRRWRSGLRRPPLSPRHRQRNGPPLPSGRSRFLSGRASPTKVSNTDSGNTPGLSVVEPQRDDALGGQLFPTGRRRRCWPDRCIRPWPQPPRGLRRRIGPGSCAGSPEWGRGWCG